MSYTVSAAVAAYQAGQLTAPIDIVDSAANVAAQLDGLEALQQGFDPIGSITLTDGGTPTLSLSAAQLGGDLGVLGQIGGNFHVSITDGGTVVVPQSQLNTFLTLQQRGELPTGYPLQFTGLELPWAAVFAQGSFLGKPLGLPAGTVVDFASPGYDAIQMISEFASLQSMLAAGEAVSVTLSDDVPASLSASQYFADQAAIDSVTNSAVFNVTGVSVAQAAAMAADPRIAKIALTDSSADILADLAGLEALAKAGKLGSVGTLILLTGAQAAANRDLVAALDQGAGFWISDTAAGISANFDAIAALQASLHSIHIQVTDQNPLRIASSQLVPDMGNFYYLPNSSIAFTDAASPTIAMTESEAQSLFAGGTLARITTPYQIAVTDSAAPLFAVKASDYASSVSILSPVQGFTLALSGVTVADADAALAQAHVAKVEVSDTGANIVANLSVLDALIVAGKVDQITQTDMAPITLSIAQLGADAPFLAHFKSDADYSGDAIYNLVGSAADLSSNLDMLTKLIRIGSITLSDGGTAAVTMTSSQWQQDQYLLSYISGPYSVTLTDGPAVLTVPYSSYYYGHQGIYDHIAGAYSLSVTGLLMSEAMTVAADPHVRSVSIADDASTLSANFFELQTLAAEGKLGAIDFETISTFQVTTTQAEYGQAVFDHIDGSYTVEQMPVAGGTTIRGVASATGNSVGYSMPAADYSVVGTGNGGVSVTNTVTHQTDQLSDIQELEFSGAGVFLVQAPSNSGTTTGNIAALYAAVLGREPDLAGLAFYQQALQANPGTPIQQFALYFLNSPEYTSRHSYAQTSAGDAQFITDTYQNLLDRAPEAGAVDWYQANVIAPYLVGLTPGTAAYAAAQTTAHAALLVYFSASPEFLGDVQVTAQHPADSQHWLMVV